MKSRYYKKYFKNKNILKMSNFQDDTKDLINYDTSRILRERKNIEEITKLSLIDYAYELDKYQNLKRPIIHRLYRVSSFKE